LFQENAEEFYFFCINIFLEEFMITGAQVKIFAAAENQYFDE
jgi:hypothetical protein